VCEQLAERLTELAQQSLPIANAGRFLTLLADWLRGADVAAKVAALPEMFQTSYSAMAAAVSTENMDDGEGSIDINQLLNTFLTLLVQGTTQQRHVFADQLAEVQRQLPSSAADLDISVGALVDWLRGGQPATTPVLAAPFAELWGQLEAAVTGQPEEN